MRRRRRRRQGKGLQLERSGPWLGIGGLFILLWLALSSSIYAPWWGVVIHVLVVVPVAVWTVRWARSRPAASAFVPLAALPLLFGVTLLGVWLDNWTA